MRTSHCSGRSIPSSGSGRQRIAAPRYVAPSQAVVDCLTGTGRMPAEGEAVLEWMAGGRVSLEA